MLVSDCTKEIAQKLVLRFLRIAHLIRHSSVYIFSKNILIANRASADVLCAALFDLRDRLSQKSRTNGYIINSRAQLAR